MSRKRLYSMKSKRIDVVCRDCAKELHWRDIPGHVCTFWVDECDRCGEKKGVCAASDYRGPKGECMGLWD